MDGNIDNVKNMPTPRHSFVENHNLFQSHRLRNFMRHAPPPPGPPPLKQSFRHPTHTETKIVRILNS